MKKNLLLAFYLLLCSLILTSAPIDTALSKRVAVNFYRERIGSDANPRGVPMLVKTYKAAPAAGTRDSLICLYIYNVGDGYVIVSGDDRVKPVLGYSTEGQFNPQNMPIQLEEWLLGYVAEIQSVMNTPTFVNSEAAASWSRLGSPSFTPSRYGAVVVAPLIQTCWDQYPYYNNLCPMIGSERTITGCVATAMAQMLYYWKYPSHGFGSHSYTHATCGVQSANFAAATYNYDLMPTSLSSSSSATEVFEVAQLMYHCGVSVDMNYGLSSAGGSGASTAEAADAFNTYFGYSCTYRGRSSAGSDAQWISDLKAELNNARPLLYSGRGSIGHAFICDGYTADNYFHFNFGWSCAYNGYYTLDNINPNPYTFNDAHGAIFDMSAANPILLTNPKSINFFTENSVVTEGRQVSVLAHSLSSNITITTTSPFAVSLDSLNYSTSVTLSSNGGNFYVRYQPASGNQNDAGTVSLVSGSKSASIDLQGFSCTISCTPPQELSISSSDLQHLHLSWDAPQVDQTEQILSWNNRQRSSLYSYGTSQLTLLQRFTEADLISHHGKSLTKITSYIVNGATMVKLVVFKGGSYMGTSIDPGTLVYEQTIPISSVTQGAWNTFDLSTPVSIEASQELWFGIYLESSATYPIPLGPTYTPQKGAIIGIGTLNSSSWRELTSGNSYSLCILGSVQNMQTVSHYEVSRDGTVLGNTNNTYYDDVVSSTSTYHYNVAAVWDNGCSSSASIAITNVASIYANPNMLALHNDGGFNIQVKKTTISSMGLSSNIQATVTGPFQISTDSVSFSTSKTLAANGGALYVRYNPATYPATPEYGIITLTSGSTTAQVQLVGQGTGDCNPPQNLTLSVPSSGTAVTATWDAPDALPVNTHDLSWHIANTNSYSYSDLSSYALQRFEPSDLAPYHNKKITAISFIPIADDLTSCKIVVFKGGSWSSNTSNRNPGSLVAEQVVPISSINDWVWNTVTLNTPVVIDATQEIWFGIYLTYSGDDGFSPRFGSPATENKSAIYSATFGNSTYWISNNSYSFAIKAAVEDSNPIFDHYQIDRNGSTLVSNTTSTSYVDNAGVNGDYDYTVWAVWSDGCQSGVSGSVSVTGGCTTPGTVTTHDQCGDTYTWHGTTYNTSGTYTYAFMNSNNCQQVDTLLLTFHNAIATEFNATECGNYTWNGQNYSQSGDYIQHFQTVHGCDSAVTLHLTIYNTTTHQFSETACDSYTWNGQTYFQSGDYTQHFQTVHGCDSTVTLHLTIHNAASYQFSETACNNYTWNDQTYTQSGDYTQHFQTVNGCDSTVTLHLTIHNAKTYQFNETACGNYTWNGQNYSQSGDYMQHFQTVNGCDSTVTLHLTIHNAASYQFSETACGNYTWNGQTYTQSGDYTQHFQTVHGCDSAVTLHLTISNFAAKEFSETACDTYTWNGQNYSQSGDYTQHFQTVNGCDSTVTLHLTISNFAATEFSETACDTYTWNGQNYSQSGDYTQHFQTVNDCDSAVTLHLTIHNAKTYQFNETACGNYTWNGQTYSQSGDHTQHFQTVNGCDSTVTLHLTISNFAATEFSETACGNYTWNGQNYSQSGDYTQHFQTVNGCDSAVTLHLTIHNAASYQFSETACGNYTWNGQIYSQSGDYTRHFQTVHGCDSAVTLHLTIHNAASYQFSETACGNYTWNGQNYSQSGDYTQHFQTIHGCDSAVTLHLTIHNTATYQFSETACDSYTWNGQTYFQSGDYTQHFQTVNGCDSTVTLHLTISNFAATEFSETACDSYTWNGQIYSQSGDYIQHFQTVNGCDSTVTLHLTIYHSKETEWSTTACDSYTWNGQIHTQSGDYTQHFQTVNGCDSAVTLHLTISNFAATEFSETACDSYTWNGQTYSQSGDYTQHFQTVNGCDSAVTLHLTISPSLTTDFLETSCDSYTWNGQNYSQSGDYVQHFHTVNGCDSAVTLHLTISGCIPASDGQPCPGHETVTDHEGNVYNTVQIGTQCWTKENLRTTTSPNTGTYFIPAAGTGYTYTGKQAFWYNNDSTTYAPRSHGLLYNWNAAADTFNTAYGETSADTNSSNAVSVTFSGHRRGICPVGWHLPSDAEWTTMTDYVSSRNEYLCDSTRNHNAKALASQTRWGGCSNNCTVGNDLTANNATGFSAVPAGYHDGSSFNCASAHAIFWSSSQNEDNLGRAYVRSLSYYSESMSRSSQSKYYGYSVRCLIDENTSATLPTVTSDAVSDITTNTANCGGNVTSDGGGTITARGVCWSTSHNPMIADAHTLDGTDTGSFTSTLTGLTPNTTYYVRAYATNSAGTAYGEEKSFTTCPIITSQFSETACDSYTWNGQSYSQSGNYTQHFQTVNGCDSAVTLHLTIYNAVTHQFAETAYDSHTWNGQTYSQSGDYTQHFQTAHGCDSAVTLHLTIISGIIPAGDAQPCPGHETVTDYEGNVYNTVKIGDQCWMKENLRTSHYSNGLSIQTGVSTSPDIAYLCFPGNNASNIFTYGMLYNWAAVMKSANPSSSNPSGIRGICPYGWHVPSDAEWTQLTDYVSAHSIYWCGNDTANIARALSSQTLWRSGSASCAIGEDLSQNNATGFSMMPSGFYNNSWDYYMGKDEVCYLWSSTADNGYVSVRAFGYNSPKVGRYQWNPGNEAYSVRCILGDGADLPAVITMDPSNVTNTTAQCNCYIFYDGGATVTERGVCWSTSPNPTVNDAHTSDNTTPNITTGYITGLVPGTTYYVRAYATNSLGTSYGTQKTFTTDCIPVNVSINSTATTICAGESMTLTASGAHSYIWNTGNSSATITVSPTVTTTYSVTGTDQYGCTGTASTSVTVHATSLTSLSETACDSYTWNGQTYYQSGDYTQNFTTVHGCDSTVTLHLTITNCIPAGDAQPCPDHETVTDYDGNVYNTVKIGNQCWMKENLRTTHYADGVAIPAGTATSETVPYRYAPNNDTNNITNYGYLYNWPAVMHGTASTDGIPSGVQGICPAGWHVPSYEEWGQLDSYVYNVPAYGCGGSGSDVKALAATTGWNNDNGNCTVGNDLAANNATGFGALPAGYYYGTFNAFGNGAYFWSTTGGLEDLIWSFGFAYLSDYAEFGSTSKDRGASVRCILGEGNNLPSVTTDTVSDIGANSATCGGNVTTDGGATITARGVCWSTSQNPTIADAHTNDGTGTGAFTSTLTGLSSNTRYYVRAYATNSEGTVYGNEVTFTTESDTSACDGQPCPGAPTVTDIDGNVYNTVKIGQQCWMKESMRTTKFPDGIDITRSYESSIYVPNYYEFHDIAMVEYPPLQGGHLYNWAAAMYGAASSNANPGIVQGICPLGWHIPSNAEWEQLTNYVSSQSQYLCDGDMNQIAKALSSASSWWDTTSGECAPGDQNTYTNNATGFSAIPMGYLSAGAYAQWRNLASFWSSTESYSSKAYSFHIYYDGTNVSNNAYWSKDIGNSVRCLRNMEDSNTSATLPTVITDTASNITETTVTCGGVVIADGGSEVTGFGVCWGISANPTLSSAYIAAGSGTGAFTVNLSELNDGTTYHVRAYAINSIGIAYGEDISFTTPAFNNGLDGLPCPGASIVIDLDGNIYNTVQIGSQCWLKENLRTTKYADGTSIPYGYYNSSFTSPYYYDYSHVYSASNPIPLSERGYLYNWSAAMHGASSSNANPSGVQGICPNGWHLPSNAEWEQLKIYVGSEYACGNAARNVAKALASTTGWKQVYYGNCCVGYTLSNNNATGFSAVPSGYFRGDYYSYDSRVEFWTSTNDYYSGYATAIDLQCGSEDASAIIESMNTGISVRCLRNESDSTTAATLPTVTTNAVSDITTNTATCGGNVISDGGTTTSRGICWSTSQNPTVDDAHTSNGTGIGTFTSTMTGLTPNTTYYVRAYATNSEGTAYGEQVTFSTQIIIIPDGDAQPCQGTPTVTDIDGNVYNTVKIGEQCWTKENLRTTKYTDGTLIPNGGNNSSDTLPYYYDYGSSNISLSERGYLYNWPAAMHRTYDSNDNPNDAQGICPTGWHLPSREEWRQLTTYLTSQSSYICGNNNTYIAKSLASTSGWNSCDSTCGVGYNQSNNNDATGFSAVPVGNFNCYSFGKAGERAAFWSSSLFYINSAWYYYLDDYNEYVHENANSGCLGLSVRCLRNESDSTTTATLPTVTTDMASNVTANAATSGGNVTSDGGATVTARGVCWNTTGTPTVSDNHTTDGTGTGAFTSTITGLTPNTTYYVRAYATNSVGTAYGNEVSFTTECPPVSVIIGDSIICNIGQLLFAHVMPAVDPNTQLHYTWYKDDMVVVSGSINQFLASETGYYKVAVSNNGCTSESSDVYVILPNTPQLQLTASGNNICEDGSTVITAEATGWHMGDILYSWSVGNHEGTSYTFVPDHAGAFTFTVTATDVYTGCESDASITINVFGQPDITISGNTDINYGQSTTLTASGASTYTWSTGESTASINVTPTITTSYSVTGTSQYGCTGMASVTVTVNTCNPMLGSEETAEACDSYTWHGATFTESGDYTDTMITAAGCDSVITLHLTIYHSTGSGLDVTACDWFFWNDSIYTTSGVYMQYFQTVHGCDSTVVLHLTIYQSKETEWYETACESYTWNDQTYYQSGDYVQYFPTFNGCDSTVTLHLTIHNAVTSQFAETACGSYTWNGQTYYQSGDFVQHFQTVHGCDSTVTLHLTINNPSNTDLYVTACDSYTWYGAIFTESGDYTDTLTSSAGCDSVLTLHLTISDFAATEFTAEACGSFTWNGQTYHQSGIYVQHFTTVNGCDSTVTLHLTVSYDIDTVFLATACDSYTWNGQTYHQSGDFVQYFQTIHGCDSTVTLHLTIHNAVTYQFAETACDSYTWNSQIYYQSGDYVQHFQTVNGCDSTVTLHLIVYYSDSTFVSQTACDSYTWNSQTYYQSGDFVQYFQTVHGCDSTVVLHLTIYQSKETEWYETACDSYTWNGQTYHQSGTYVQYFPTVPGCDSIVVLHLTIYQSKETEWYETACDSYTWNGQTYYQSGDYTQYFTTVHGCDSAVTLHLTVHYSAETEFQASACDSFTWNGQTYTQSGDYVQHFQTIHGCDSTVTMHLVVHYSNSAEFDTTVCDSFTWNGQTCTTSGDYVQHFQTIHGCDSTVTVHFTVHYSTITEFDTTVCNSFTWNSQVYDTTGNYIQHFQTIHGCDSMVTAHLVVNYSKYNSVDTSSCDSFSWNSQTYTQSGDYTQHFTTVHGCDSAVTLHLTINNSVTRQFSETTCDSYTWNGQTYTQSGDYVQHFQTIHGCDSTVTLHLTIHNSATHQFTETACDSYTWNGQTYTSSGDYTQHFQTVHGCDSTVMLHLTIHNATTSQFSETACDSYTWNGQTYTQSGDYVQHFQTIHGCDSTVTLHLTIHNTATHQFTETACDSYTWNGQTYTSSGDYTQHFQTVHGCDSTVTLHLTIHNTATHQFTETACDSYTWNEQTYTSSGDYTQHFQTVHGCDSTVTLHLIVNHSIATEFDTSECGSYTWNGQTYTQSGNYVQNFQTVHGCDSAVTLHLTIHNAVAHQFAETACNSYTWNGQTYHQSGDYVQHFQTVHGCDSTVTLHLTIHNAATHQFTETACDSYTWNGQTYTQSGDYTQHFTTVHGCDSAVTLHLTIHNSVTYQFAETACDSYTWNGQTYHQSGDYMQHFTTVHGCDSTVTLHLTIYNAATYQFSETACDSYIWNGQTYTQSGDFVQHFQTIHGCDSAVTLHLTIHNAATSQFTETACDSYTWNGQTYTTSGDYMQHFQTVHGCDSTVTLHLTIHNAVTHQFSETACDSYTWNGQTYAQTGDYVKHFTTVHGCDSTVTLHLTIHHAASYQFSETACDSYTWNGQTYHQSGNYVQHFQTVHGCDSTVTLHLTLLPNPTVTVTGNASFCEGSSSQLTATGGGTYQWSTGSTQPVITVSQSGTYTVTATNADGCSATASIVVTAHPLPQIVISGNTTICAGSSTTLTATGASSYIWNTGNQSASLFVNAFGMYSVTGTSSDGCVGSADVMVLVAPLPDIVIAGDTNICQGESTMLVAQGGTAYIWSDGSTDSTMLVSTAGYHQVMGFSEAGCHNVATATVHVWNPDVNEETVSVSDSCYTWNGETYCQSGDYVQTLQNMHGCDSTVTLHLTLHVGIGDHSANNITLYPNPTRGTVQIRNSGSNILSVTVFDASGRMLNMVKVNDHTAAIDLSGYAVGTYFLRIMTENGVVTKRVVKSE